MVSELVDNFALHSEGPLAAFMMQMYRHGNRFALAIGDCGIGIRASLSQNPAFAFLAHEPHHKAAEMAFRPRVSRRPNAGTGLTEVEQTAIDMRGKVRLATGDGYVRIYPREGTRVGKQLFHLPGVQVEVTIPLTDE